MTCSPEVVSVTWSVFIAALGGVLLGHAVGTWNRPKEGWRKGDRS